MDDFAESENEDRNVASENGGMEGEDQPGKRSDKRTDDDGGEGGNSARQKIDEQGESDDGDCVGGENPFDTGVGVDVGVHVAGQADVLLPVDDPVAGEDQQEKHEAGIAEHDEEIAERARDAGGGLVGGALWFTEEEQDEEKHREDAERGDAEDRFEAEMFVRPAGDVRPGGAADVDHGVVNRIADAADIGLGGARGGADDGGLDHGNAERGENEDDADEETERDGVADWREPGSGDGADEEVGGGKNQIGDRKRATEAKTVGDSSTENGEKPNHAAKDAGERAGLFGGEI